MQQTNTKKAVRPARHQQEQPGLEDKMEPSPVFDKEDTPRGKLHNKVALITGGDSGIGRAVAVAFARAGAIVSFVRSLSASLTEKGIRVNGVAPGPIWTPLIPATFKPEEVARFGTDVPLKRAGQPVEVAPCYVFLASDDASYFTGQILHPNGGEIING